MSRLTLSFIAALLMLAPVSVKRQDGRIVDQRAVSLNEALRKEIISKAEFTSAFKTPADIFAVIDRVDMREITYLSDGLRVKGFVLAPNKEGRALKDWLDHYVRDGKPWPSLEPERK
jgi:hypothetical protein